MQSVLTASILRIFGYGVILATAMFLWNNLNYFTVPDPDIFQYFQEGRQYIAGRLPTRIQLSPAYPILIQLVTKLVSVPYPELGAAHAITIFSAILTLFCVFQFLKPYGIFSSLTAIILLSTNPTFIYSSLNVNTEVFFAPFVVLVLIFYQRGHAAGAYMMAAASFFVRYEGFVLLLSIIVADVVSKQKPQSIVRLSLLALFPIILWTGIAQTRNVNGNILGNGFIREVIQHHEKIPQFTLYMRAPDILINQAYFDMSQNRGIVAIYLYGVLILCSVCLVKTNDAPLLLMLVFTFLYLLFHAFFPYGPDRYFYPIIWVFYTIPLVGPIYFYKVGLKRRFPGFLVLVFLFTIYVLGTGNITQTLLYYSSDQSGTTYSRYNRNEVRDVANWLNNQEYSKKVFVFVYEPWLPEYFTYNTNIKFVNLTPTQHARCDSIECLMLSTGIDPKANILLYIQQSDTLYHDSSFPSAGDFNIKIYNEPILKSTHPNMLFIERVATTNAWANIYQYKPKE